MSTFIVEISPKAEADLSAISDKRTQRAISTDLLRLETEPAKRGKKLGGDLSGYYSIRLAGQRYRGVYTVAVAEGVVTVLIIGIRKAGDRRDVYQLARRRVRGE